MPGAYTDTGLKELLQGVHVFAAHSATPATVADTFKVAFYQATATIGKATSVYSATGEVTGGGYTAGGIAIVPTLTEVTINSVKKQGLTFSPIEFVNNPTFSFKYAILYNTTAGHGNRVFGYWEWTTTQTAQGTTYSVRGKRSMTMPPILFG